MYKKILAKHWSGTGEVVHLEFGVFNGTSLSAAFRAYEELGIEARIVAFDSFKGLPEESYLDDLGQWSPGEYFCTRTDAERCMEMRGVDLSKIEIIEGWYKDTLNESQRDDLGIESVDVVFMDCDTYVSSKAAFNFIELLITRKTLLCMDDWRLHNLDLYELGESKSYKEFISDQVNISAKRIKSYNRKSESYILTKE